jgi:hypothetical protein
VKIGCLFQKIYSMLKKINIASPALSELTDGMETLMKNYGFSIQKVIKTPGWTGCNQFVFKKDT